MLRKLMVVIVVVLALLPATALAQEATPRLVFSHFQCNGTSDAELHFVLQGTSEDLTGTFVQWYATLDSVPVNGQALYTGTTGSVAHYAVDVPVSPGAHEFTILGATFITLAGGDVPLFNPQTVRLQSCAPLLNQLSMQATCVPAPYGVLIEWQMSSQVGVYHFVGEQNGYQIFDVPANCPGCMDGAEYSYMHITDTPNGSYRLRTGVEAQVVDVICQVPTAVHLASLKAQTEPPVPTDNLTLEFLGTLAGAALATWLTVNALVRAMPNLKAKIVAIPAALFWTVGASVLLAYPDVTAATVFLAVANSLLVYFTATGGATMLAARAAEPKRARVTDKEPFNKAWW